MKKFILLAVLTAIQFCSFGQNTMKFLGIPIDGSKTQMIEALKNKGYSYDRENDCLRGEFNGQDVRILIKTNNNKVCRLAIVDDTFTDKTNIRIKFNNLFDQFSNNGKYLHAGGKTIPKDEDLSYEITVHKKRYEADFIPVDSTINGTVWYMITDMLGKYGIVIFYENLDNMPNGDDL